MIFLSETRAKLAFLRKEKSLIQRDERRSGEKRHLDTAAVPQMDGIILSRGQFTWPRHRNRKREAPVQNCGPRRQKDLHNLLESSTEAPLAWLQPISINKFHYNKFNTNSI